MGDTLIFIYKTFEVHERLTLPSNHFQIGLYCTERISRYSYFSVVWIQRTRICKGVLNKLGKRIYLFTVCSSRIGNGTEHDKGIKNDLPSRRDPKRDYTKASDGRGNWCDIDYEGLVFFLKGQ